MKHICRCEICQLSYNQYFYSSFNFKWKMIWSLLILTHTNLGTHTLHLVELENIYFEPFFVQSNWSIDISRRHPISFQQKQFHVIFKSFQNNFRRIRRFAPVGFVEIKNLSEPLKSYPKCIQYHTLTITKPEPLPPQSGVRLLLNKFIKIYQSTKECFKM